MLAERECIEVQFLHQKGTLGKACYTEMPEKSSTVKANIVTVAPNLQQPTLTYEPTNLQTGMVRTELSTNTVTSSQHSQPMVKP